MSLPNTYYRLDYIQSSGNQYINTNITGYTAFKLKFQLLNTGSNQYGIFGSRQSGASNRFGCMVYSGLFHFMIGNSNTWNASVDTNVHELDFNSTRLIADNVEYITPSGQNYGSSAFYLFAMNLNSSGRIAQKIWYFQTLDENGNITRNFIPAMRKSDSVVGLYDDVNDVFYTNAGSGTFTYGSIMYEVSVSENPQDSGTITGTGYYPSGSTAQLEATANSGYLFENWELQDYTLLDYIESSGTQYIDTGLAPSYNLKALVKGRFTSNTGNQYAIGCYQASNINRFDVGLYNSTLQLNIGSYKEFSGVDVTQTHTYILDAPNNCTYIDNTQYTGYSTQTGSNARNVLLFARNQSSITYYANFQAELYQFWNNGVLVRNYKPVKRNSDSAIGLLDLVEMKFYANNGTGTFTYGEELGKITYTDNPLSLTVNSDLNLIANFKLNYQITLNYDSTLGNATYDWVSGTQIQLVATPNSNAYFVGWYINSVLISNSATYTYTVLGDTTIEARFGRIWNLTLNTDGNGTIDSYRYGEGTNNATITVIPNSNYHFIKYVIVGLTIEEAQLLTENEDIIITQGDDNLTVLVSGTSESTTTPLNILLQRDVTVTAYFEEDEKYHISVSSTFPYGSFFISDNDVYDGTVVTIWARPFPDYYFVGWEDGETANPRQIVVHNNITLIGIYQRQSDTNGIYQYRCYIKDQLDLESPPKAFMVVDTFDITTDLLTNATSSITVMKMLSDINEGDVLVLYDPMGNTLYTGVINSIEDLTINCSQMQSFYKGTWIYNVSPQDFLEHEIAVLLQDYADGKLYRSNYVDPLVAQRLGGITIEYEGATTVNLPTDLDDDGNEQMTTYDMEEFIYELYQKYSIKFDFEINLAGTNYVRIRVPSFEAIKVGNNMYAIQDMSPITEIEETNKLVIYAQDKTYRTTYIATKTGIVEAPSLTVNRFNITNTEVVFSDDPVEDLIANSLPSQMYNHKLTFTLIIKNFIYQFGDFNLGGELDIYYNDDYFNSVLTGYEISKNSNQNITEVFFTCGTVRTALTKMLTLGKV